MTRYLKQILLPLVAAAAIAALMLPILNEWLITPSFTRYFKENTRKEALLVAAHLSSILIEREVPLERKELRSDFDIVTARVTEDFELIKLKVFSPSGEIIYSSDPEEIGGRNRKDYFHNVVAYGNPYIKLVNKGRNSLEDQVFTADVAETYVPVMAGERFLGAFEIYYDVTSRLESLEVLLARTKGVVYAISLALLALTIFSFLKARRALEAQRQLEEKLQEARRDLAQRVAERTAELSVTVKQLQMEVSERREVEDELRRSEENFKALAENASDAILISSVADGKPLFANAKAAEMAGCTRAELLEKPITEFVVPDEPRRKERVGGRGVASSVRERRYSATLASRGGGERAVEVSASRTHWHGQEVGLLLARDLPERYRDNAKREALIRRLRESLERAHVLGGFIPICSYCKKIRDDRGAWHQLEEYFAEHSEVVFTHGLCPDCVGEMTH